MALIVNDRVRESTAVVGTGTATLLGAITGYQSFSVIGNGNTCYYTIADQTGANWEVGIGTYTSSGTTLARTTVLKSSNSNNLVSFTSGTKDVFVTYPAETAVYGGGGGTYPTVQPTLNLDFTNSKTVDPRITFVRNSTATYYDGQTTALAEQNLFLQSQFVASWATLNSTLTSNIAVAPDGTTTAATLIPTTATSIHGVVQSVGVIGNQYTYSVYGKSNGYTNLQLYADSSGNFNATFDLTAGTAASTGGATVSIVSVGSGWYRCIATFTQASNTRLNVQGFPTGATANNFGYSFTGDGTSGIYIWGAQLEQRSTATAYTPTTTTAITNYIPVLMTAATGVPRLDYNPTTGQALGLLIEESRANLLLYSATFTNAAWTLTNATLTSTANVAPDGTQTAFNLVDSTATGLQAIAQTYTKAASAIAYTSSVYFKANQRTYSWLQISDGAGNGAIVYFNLTTGVISTAVAGIGTAFTSLSATITLVGNSWYKCTITGTSNTATSLVTQFGSSTNGTSNSFTGNGYSGIYIWGAQLEAGAFATSYIPTVASTVTRAVDAASMIGTNFSSWWNVNQSTFVVEFDKPNLTNLGTLIGVYGGQIIAQIEVTSNAIGSNLFAIFQPSGTISNGIGSSSVSSNKFAVSFGANLFAPNDGIGAINGAGGIFGTGSYFPNPLFNSLYIGLRQHYGDQKLNGHIRKLSYYPVALSSSNLVALTS